MILMLSLPNGAMTTVKFEHWLEKIFVPKARYNLDDDSWVLLCLDNCSCYISFNALQLAYKYKVAMAPFHLNCTHACSPLDVSLYGPFKKLLKDSLKKRNKLKYFTITSWISPAVRHVFTQKKIKDAFEATGLWNRKLNGPDISHVNSQFQHLMTPLPKAVIKANIQKKGQIITKMINDKMERFHDEQITAASKGCKASSGPSYVSKSVAGTVVSETTLGLILEKRNQVVEMKEKHKAEVASAKIQDKEKWMQNIFTLKEKHQVTIEQLRHDRKNARQDTRYLRKELISSENNFAKARLTVNEDRRAFELLFEHCDDLNLGAEDLFKFFERRRCSGTVIKTIRKKYKKPPAPKRKRNLFL